MMILLIRYLSFVSVLLYFVFDYYESKRIKDEREEFIRLKTFELIQRLTIVSLTLIAISFIFYPAMPAIFPVMVIVLASLYGEIFGKIYFRRKY